MGDYGELKKYGRKLFGMHQDPTRVGRCKGWFPRA
jgi:hypothetical protein